MTLTTLILSSLLAIAVLYRVFLMIDDTDTTTLLCLSILSISFAASLYVTVLQHNDLEQNKILNSPQLWKQRVNNLIDAGADTIRYCATNNITTSRCDQILENRKTQERNFYSSLWQLGK